VEDNGWITTAPVAKKSIPTYRSVLEQLGHEVSEHEETTADGIVLRYRPAALRGGEHGASNSR
jgi:hypothetical protein